MIRKAFIVMLTVSAVAAGVLAVRAPVYIRDRMQFGDTDQWSGRWYVLVVSDHKRTMIAGGLRRQWSPLSRSFEAWKQDSIPVFWPDWRPHERDYALLLKQLDKRIGAWQFSRHHSVFFTNSKGRHLGLSPDLEAKAMSIAVLAPWRSLVSALWGLTGALALYPAWALMFGPVRRWRRRRRGLCVGCGYNLTGNVSGVCPECGRRR